MKLTHIHTPHHVSVSPWSEIRFDKHRYLPAWWSVMNLEAELSTENSVLSIHVKLSHPGAQGGPVRRVLVLVHLLHPFVSSGPDNSALAFHLCLFSSTVRDSRHTWRRKCAKQRVNSRNSDSWKFLIFPTSYFLIIILKYI